MLYMVVQEKSRPGCPGCLSYERLARSQTHMMNWWATEEKTNKQLGCETESKNSWRLTSRSRESSLTWIHSDRAGAQNCRGTQLWAHSGNAIHHTVSVLVSNPVLTWPPRAASSLKPRWFWGPQSTQMLRVCTLRIYRDHRRHSVTTHLCLSIKASATQTGSVG